MLIFFTHAWIFSPTAVHSASYPGAQQPPSSTFSFPAAPAFPPWITSAQISSQLFLPPCVGLPASCSQSSHARPWRPAEPRPCACRAALWCSAPSYFLVHGRGFLSPSLQLATPSVGSPWPPRVVCPARSWRWPLPAAACSCTDSMWWVYPFLELLELSRLSPMARAAPARIGP
jgi:hypothetical protein